VILDPLQSSWSDTIAQICAARPERGWIPGQKAGYHPYSSWYILGELVRRADGRTIDQYVRQEIFLPLGMIDSWIGMPAEERERHRERMGVMLQLDRAEPYPQRYDTPEGAGLLVPGGNARGPMHDLGRFYQMLLGHGELDGARVLSRESVERMTTPQRVGMFDETFRHVMDWGLGTIIDSNRYARHRALWLASTVRLERPATAAANRRSLSPIGPQAGSRRIQQHARRSQARHSYAGAAGGGYEDLGLV
jgi:CubicO group peptidase (beta-lactamase class C family)